jgi:hypothetical protein
MKSILHSLFSNIYIKMVTFLYKIGKKHFKHINWLTFTINFFEITILNIINLTHSGLILYKSSLYIYQRYSKCCGKMKKYDNICFSQIKSQEKKLRQRA